MSFLARVWKGEMAAPNATPRFQTPQLTRVHIPVTPRHRRSPPQELLQRLAQPASSDALRQHSPSYEG